MQELHEYIQSSYSNEIRHIKKLPEQPAQNRSFPADLKPELAAYLRAQSILELYSHQAECFDSVSTGKNTVLVSHTASGKTLAFLLPIINSYLNNPNQQTTLLLYPTKALSRDQQTVISDMLKATAPQGHIGTFDGDTPREERQSLVQNGDFVISNPDMLHSGILPHHQRWSHFFSRLQYIVIDEVHMYRGAYGSHIANLLRRLLRICKLHGANPQFICCSATIGNPKEHVENLCSRKFKLISNDGPSRPKRSMYFLNPPLYKDDKGTEHRKGPASLAIPIIRAASKLNIRTICFARARQAVERLTTAVLDGQHTLQDRIKPYRGGLLPSERRKLEHQLKNKKLNTIITTNALELGIDIGDLNLCIINGFPGTVTSFWQQAGRVGRNQQESIVIYIAKNTPIDQFIAHNPDYLLNAPLEQAWLSLTNPYISLQHVPCAAYEYPLSKSEPFYPKQSLEDCIDELVEAKTLQPVAQFYHYALQDYPARGVNLRGLTDHNIQISDNGIIIGELDPIGARGSLYKDAIYQHLGRKYMSIDLNLDDKLCQVKKTNVDYYTEAVWESDVKHIEVIVQKTESFYELKFGYVGVNKQPKMYKKIRERSFENIGFGPITLAAFYYETTGFSLTPSLAWLQAIGKADKRHIQAALYGLAYILKGVAPGFCMADKQDIDTEIALSKKTTAEEYANSLFLFDCHEGGVGYSEKIYEKLKDTLLQCQVIIDQCECTTGCPACIPPSVPGIDNQDLEEYFILSDAIIQSTKSLLVFLLDGQIILPKVQSIKKLVPNATQEEALDPQRLAYQQKLARANKILARKRTRLH